MDRRSYFLIALGVITLGVVIYQFILYDIKELTSTRSILKLVSVFTIAVSSIIGGLLIRKTNNKHL